MPTRPSPAITDLPVEHSVAELRSALADTGVAVLTAEPGAGKTTIVPLRLIDEEWLGGRRIMVLEPRRIAARAAARRMSSLVGRRVGDLVGYRTRDDSRVSSSTRIEVVTEGILTRRLQRDPELTGIGLVIFDELHERSLQTDLGLALALDVRGSLRPDLRLLAMSATIDAQRVADTLGAGERAPIIAASGRQFPVEIRYRAVESGADMAQEAALAVIEAATADLGDVLVFLPGVREIDRCISALRRRVGPLTDVLGLHGRLGSADQDRAIAPGPPGRTKIVVATDIAETSLTVEGVGLVVDAGRSRAPSHDRRTGMTRLVTRAASVASADQRAGRAGRSRPGVAVRLWSEVEHGHRPRWDEPEILVAELSPMLCELAAWGVDAVESLNFIDAPPQASVEAGWSLLELLGAVDGAHRLTGRGRAMVDLPLHPRLAAMIAGAEPEDRWMACAAAATLDERDVLTGAPWRRPVDLALRVQAVDGADSGRRGEGTDADAVRRTRRRAEDLARRSGVARGPVVLERLGAVVASGYPDRVGKARGARGHFLLANGAGAVIAEADPMATAGFIVAADVEADPAGGRVRLAVGLDEGSISRAVSIGVEMDEAVEWDGRSARLMTATVHRLGAVVLARSSRPAKPSVETVDFLIGHVRDRGLSVFAGHDAALALAARVELIRNAGIPDLPPVGVETLSEELDAWLRPLLASVTNARALARVDVVAALSAHLGWHQRREIDRLAPVTFSLPSGRSARIDYEQDHPTVSGRVQEFFGEASTPTIVDGRVPLRVVLMSPADRPVQVTTDLAGFWSGSWTDVRRDMAGRYPKHRWPVDPIRESPGHR